MIKSLASIWLMALLFNASAHSIELNRGNQGGISEAYGFVFGQQMSLERISVLYPDLAREALLAQLSFERAFGDIPAKVELMLKEALGIVEYQNFRSAFEKTLTEQIHNEPLTREMAKNFLEEVRSRGEGNIHSPVLEFLLAIKFSEFPADEFAKGFRQKYRTDGSGKSRGVVLEMQVPRSWQTAEGYRPHIVQKWKSEAGTGMELIMLQVRETEGVYVSSSDVVEMMQSGEIESMVPSGGVLEDYGMVSVENLPGYFMDFGHLQERAGMVIYQKIRQYSFFYRDRMIAVHCSAGSLESEHESVELRFEKVKPLCVQVFNSVVLPDKYESVDPGNGAEEEKAMPAI
ncbi:hypothetical protein [Marinobacter sp. ANT_B65]|uniref:hypothetical protein n=1 Tax=Marinobacter sp. ANT_B65 TaxID=2039467 RepID=UPI000BBE9615|nr:hypothetical protein [Marinobacter sp. ANT_B65]PCM45938.1 hypothetical protein CPA50_08260 [Marinobacter sp. ANT_B65]